MDHKAITKETMLKIKPYDPKTVKSFLNCMDCPIIDKIVQNCTVPFHASIQNRTVPAGNRQASKVRQIGTSV